MVVTPSFLRNDSSASVLPGKGAPPTLRYAREETLTGTLGVKSRLFGVRRRFVRLERGMLTIHQNGDDCGQPLASARVCEAHSIVANKARSLIHVRTTLKVGITLVFKHDVALMELWSAALQRSHTAHIETYYKKCAEIGAGHYARVYEAVDRRTGEKVAIKEVPKVHEDPKVMQYAKREAEIARMVRHPNVVETLDVFETSSTVFIVMEFVEYGTLFDFLGGGKNRINEKNALRFIKQLLRAIVYLHSENIVHRDIKPENILVSAEGNIKLADFGLARVLDGVCCDEYCLSSLLGTPAYCSPEVVTKKQYGKPIDVYGCGALLYIALSGALPFRGKTPEEVFGNIAHGNVEFPKARWSLISDDARHFVEQLLSFSPEDRPTAEEALGHPWLRSNGDRQSDERPLSPRPFVRNTSARTSQNRTPAGGLMPRVTSTTSFRRAQSGSLKQLNQERQNRMMVSRGRQV